MKKGGAIITINKLDSMKMKSQESMIQIAPVNPNQIPHTSSDRCKSFLTHVLHLLVPFFNKTTLCLLVLPSLSPSEMGSFTVVSLPFYFFYLSMNSFRNTI